MMRRKGLFILVFWIAAASVGLGADEEKFVYDPKKARDPFIPLITDEVRFNVGMTGIEKIDDIVLEGIVWDPAGDSYAIVNGMILRANEQVNNVKITKIESTRITIMINENEFTINLVEDEEGDKNDKKE